MTKKTSSVRISNDADAFLYSHFENRNAGMNKCVEIVREASKEAKVDEIVDNLTTLNHIRRGSLKEISGRFSENEWGLLLHILGEAKAIPEIRCISEAIVNKIDDADRFEDAAALFNVDSNRLIEKIKALTAAQLDALYYRVENFSNEKNLEKWAKW